MIKKRYLFLDPTGDPIGHARLKEVSKLSYDSRDWSTCVINKQVFTGWHSKKFKSYIATVKEEQLDTVINNVNLFIKLEDRDMIRQVLEREHTEWLSTKKFSVEACLAIPRQGPLSYTELRDYWLTLTSKVKQQAPKNPAVSRLVTSSNRLK